MYLLFFLAAFIILCIIVAKSSDFSHVSAKKRYGDKIEQEATNVIQKYLCTTDYLFTNVKIMIDGKRREYDNIIVNQYGVFIIEVKGYVGMIYGDKSDKKWIKVKETYPGQQYKKEIDNPLLQINGQMHVLKNYLKENYGIYTWIESFIWFWEYNSPIKHEQIIEQESDIGRIIHTPTKKILSGEQVEKIRRILSAWEVKE